MAPPRPEPRRNDRRKIGNPAFDTRQAMNIAARKTRISVCDRIVGRRTQSGCLFGSQEYRLTERGLELRGLVAALHRLATG